MPSARAVHLLSVDLSADGGAVDLSRLDVISESEGRAPQILDVPVHRAALSGAACREREALLREVESRERRSLGDDLLLGERDRDHRTARLEGARRAVDLWDHDHLFAPLLPALRTPALVLHSGFDAQRLDLRAAQRQAIRSGRLPLSTMSDVLILPIWPSTTEELDRLIIEVALDGLPIVEPGRTTFLLGPAPPDPFLNTIAEMSPEDGREAMLSMPAELTALAFRALVRDDFVTAALSAGVSVVPEATSEHLTRLPASPGGALFVLAHQDERGVYMHDRPVSATEVVARLSGPSPGACGPAEVPYSTVDLSVCLSQRRANLAAAYQTLGATVVLTRGEVGYDMGMFRRFLQILELLRDGHRLSLPELHDRAWSRDEARPSGH